MDSEFRKNFLSLFTGTAAAQAIPFLLEPVISRLFLPQEFGVFELYVAFVTIIGSIATLRYEMAIVLPAKNSNAFNIFALSFLLTLFVSFLSLLVFSFFGGFIAKTLRSPQIIDYYWLIPLGVLVFGAYRAFYYWFMRKEKFALMSATKITESAIKGGSTTVFGFLKYSSFGLVLGQFLGQLFSLLTLVWPMFKYERKNISSLSWKKMRLLAKEYSDFPKINVPQTLVDMIQFSGLVFIISAFFSVEILGQYSKAIRVMLIPLSVIGTSVNQVFYQKAAALYQNGFHLRTPILKLSALLLFISIPFMIIGILYSPEIFAFVLGDNWYQAGEFAAILIPWFFIKFILSAALSIPLIVDEQKTFLFYSVIGNVILVVSVVIGGYYFNDIYKTLYLFSWTQVLFNIFLALWLYKIAGKKKEITNDK